MSQLWRRAKSGEAQDLESSQRIIVTHLCTRGFQAGSVAGAVIGAPFFSYQARFPSTFYVLTTFRPWIFATTAFGGICGIVPYYLLSVYRCTAWKEIELKDQAWKLLGDKKQLEYEDWTYSAMLLCGAWGSVQQTPEVMSTLWKESTPMTIQRLVPPKAARRLLFSFRGVAFGSMVGPAAYMVWRYGVKRGEIEEEP